MKTFNIPVRILMIAVILLIPKPAFSLVAEMRTMPYGLPQPKYYSGAWVSNSDDIFAIDLTLEGVIPDPYEHWVMHAGEPFYMYEWGQPSNNLLLFCDEYYSAATVTFFKEGSDWIASVFSHGTTDTLNLGQDRLFGFFFGSKNDPLLTYQLERSSSDSYTLTANLDNSVMIVSLSDVTPAPLPGAVWLLGSGLAGLITVRKRKK